MRHRHFFRAFWLMCWLPLALALCGAIAQLWWVQAQPPRYFAIGKMVPETRHMPGERVAALESPRGQLNAATERERLLSAPLKRQALERVWALHPEWKEVDVSLTVILRKESGIARILASGTDAQYTEASLNAFLDEAMATSVQKIAAAWRAYVVPANTEESHIKAWTEAPFIWVIMERPAGVTLGKSSLVQASWKGAAAGLGLGLLMALATAFAAAFVPTPEPAEV
jgi:hypothetical protein